MPTEFHDLHKLVRKLITESKTINAIPGVKPLFDSACIDGNEDDGQHLPLFFGERRANEDVYCNVDGLILKDKKVAVIIEIEESGMLPTKICGKFLTSALSATHLHGEREAYPIQFAENVLFIQVLRVRKDSPEHSKITAKWENLEKSINAILPLYDFILGKHRRVKAYRLFYEDLESFSGEPWERMEEAIEAHLKYIIIRDEYKPDSIEFLLVGESPPVSGNYFYYDTTTGYDFLFRGTMKALRIFPENGTMPAGMDKKPKLGEFKSRGFFVIDITYKPVNKLSDDDRKNTILKEIPNCVAEIKKLDPKWIIIVKKTTFNDLKSKLKEAHLDNRILNSEGLTNPASGHELDYIAELRPLIDSKNKDACGENPTSLEHIPS